MIGAIVGDIVGSRFVFNDLMSKDFKFFHPDCHVADGTIMTLAIGDALVEYRPNRIDLAGSAVRKMRLWEARYLDVGHGPAMHVSFCGWAGTTLKESLWMAHEVIRATHDHPEGLAGAEIVAALVFLARRGIVREDLRKYVEMNYRKVPQAIMAFLESTDFVDAIRNAVSLGGDSDTIAAITGSIAEAFYGVPSVVREKALQYLDARQKKTTYTKDEFWRKRALTLVAELVEEGRRKDANAKN